MTELEHFEQVAKEYLETSRQSGKSETSGLVAAIFKSLQDMERERIKGQNNIYLALIAILLVMYAVSAFYVVNTQVTRANLNDAVAQAMVEYIDLNTNYEEN